MKRQHTVVGIGEILWDRLPGGKQLGGAPANFVYHAAALGAAGHIVSAVGNDPLGREIGERLAALNLDHRYLAVNADYPTGTVDVQLDPDGKPRYVIHEQGAWDFIPWSDALRDLAKQTAAVCYGSLSQRAGISRQTIRAFITTMPSASLRVFDVNFRQAFFSGTIVHDLLSLSNVLKISDEELPVVSRLLSVDGSDEDVIRTLMSRYRLCLVALTRGAQGSVLVASEGAFTHPGVRANIVDTVGAGDAFTAGMVMGMLHGLDFNRISDLANRLAAYVCSQPGATPKIPEALVRLAEK